MRIAGKKISLTNIILLCSIPAAIFVFYAIPAGLTYLWCQDKYSLEMLSISVFSIVIYIGIYVSNFDMIIAPIKIKKYALDLSKIAYCIVAFFSIFMVYVSITAPSIPLWDAIIGSNIDTISNGRETFLRTREGWEISLNYIFAICRSFLMPFAMCWLFYIGSRWRFHVVLLFLFSLCLTLEKSACIMALVPLFFFVTAKSRRLIFGFIGLIFVLVSVTAFLARGGLNNDSKNLDGALSSVPAQYMIFDSNSQLAYVVNRVVYIPYATGIDWLKYRDDIMGGEYSFGRNISIFSLLYGEEKINLERSVFAYEWGQNESGTGSANTGYFIESYINWGLVGVVIYNMIICRILRMAIQSEIQIMKACIFMPLIILSFNSLSAMLFSGGLFLFVFLCVFFKPKTVCFLR